MDLGKIFNFKKAMPKTPADRTVINTETSKLRKKGNILRKINSDQIHRHSVELTDWRMALATWEQPDHPDRYNMIQLYNEIALDNQVQTKMKTISSNILASEFIIIDENKKRIEDIEVEITNSFWFRRLVRYFIESEMQGFSLVQMLKVDDSYVVDLIPREMVQPDKGFIRKYPHDNHGFSMYDKSFAHTMLYIGEKDDKGLFNQLAPVYIYKKNAMQTWANYQAKFGIPAVIAQADLLDETIATSTRDFLKGLENNHYAIVDRETNVQMLSNSSGSDSYKTFNEMISYCDAAISKVMDGQTMTSDDGASLSQAEVHKQMADMLSRARIMDFLSFFNGQVMPILISDGFLPQNAAKLSYIESQDKKAIINQITELAKVGFITDDAQVSELTGLDVTYKPDSNVNPLENGIQGVDPRTE